MSLRNYARGHRFGSRLTLIAILGFAWRVVYDVISRHRLVGGDGFRYHYGALLLADGKGFLNPLALTLNVHVPDTGHPPGWALVLAGATKLGLRTWLEHGLFTSAVGTATIVMTGMAARAAFGRERVGLIAAALAAFYPFVWLYEREVLSEPLAMLLIATTIWLAYKFIATPRIALVVALGGALGALAMTESELLAVAVVLVAPLILSRREVDIRRRIGWLTSAAALCIAIMAPWSIYLSSRFDRPIVLTGAIGSTMAAGNCAQTYHGALLGYFSAACVYGVPAEPGGDVFDRDAQMRRRAINFMRHHESRVPIVSAARIGRTFGFFRPFQQMRLETVRGTSVWVFRIGFVVYWALLPFAVVGALITRARKIPVYPLLAFFAVVVWTVLFTIGSVRYRAPAEVSLVVLAAVGVDAAVVAGRRQADRLKAPAPVPPESSPSAVAL